MKNEPLKFITTSKCNKVTETLSSPENLRSSYTWKDTWKDTWKESWKERWKERWKVKREGITQWTKIAADINQIIQSDPAIKTSVIRKAEVLFYAGVWAMFFYRTARVFFTLKIPILPRLISQIGRFLTGVEIHPGAQIDGGLFIDHGMGIVIGETAVIGKNVTIYHGVTLGGTSSEPGKRHPTVQDNVFLGAGAKILGNIVLGEGCKIGAQAVVTKSVPPGATAVGIPAKIIHPKKQSHHGTLPEPCACG